MNIKTALIGFSLSLALPALALAAQVPVSIGVNSISPSTIDVNAGDTVVWTNTSGVAQSIVADNGTFQSGSIAPSAQFAATFNTSGTYNYYDNASGFDILGTVVVGGTSVSTPLSTTSYINPNATYQSVSTPNSNSTLASLQAEVQSLLAEISALEGGSTTTGVSTNGSGSCPQIGRILSLGTSGSDVSSLQTFLGVSPASGYYGTQTQTAVEQWQAANNIISSGTPDTTGYGVVGPRTASAIRLACSGTIASVSNTGSTNTGTVGGFLQVTPITGVAPLSVNVAVTVNAASSCTGATYTLNYGDNTTQQTITVPSGNCSPQNETFTHTYQYGGTFTVTLAAGSHASTATVTVSGPAAPNASGAASGSISAVVSAGTAPFNATFYVSCASGQAYDVNFGDGTDLGSSGISQSSCNGGLEAVTHTYKTAGSFNAQLIIFVANSNGSFSQEAVASQPVSVTAVAPAASTYQPPTLTPNASGNALEVSLSYPYDSSGCEVSISWGDGQTTGPSGCTTFTGALQTFTQTHTYSAAGTYHITLTRDSQTNTVGVTIQ